MSPQQSILSLISLHLLKRLLNCSLDIYHYDPLTSLLRLKQELPTLFEKVGYVSQRFFDSTFAAMKFFFESNRFPITPQDLPIHYSLASLFKAEVESFYVWEKNSLNLIELAPYCNSIIGVTCGAKKDDDLDFLNCSSTFYFSRLKELDLCLDNVSLCTKLSEVLKINSTLTTLSLARNSVGDKGVVALAEGLKVNSTITDINFEVIPCSEQFDFEMISIQGAKALAEVLKVNSTISRLGLSLNAINDEAAIILANALKRNSSLTSLAEVLKVNSTISRLGLSLNAINDEAAIILANALKRNSSLTSIDLYYNCIASTDAIALFEMLRENSTLTEIELAKNSIGPDAISTLVEVLKVNNTVDYVNLRGNFPYTDVNQSFNDISNGRFFC
ncbi:hypothetical protein GEMRC1_012936 [Eukaryota sp. GEM-RC1]